MDRPTGFAGVFRTDLAAREAYSESAGIMRVVPAAVALPCDVDDLQALCAWATASGAGLIPRGSGSSMSGAAVGPGVIVDLHRFRRSPEVDRDRNRLRVGTAVTRARVDDAARAHGLRFPVDPSSGAFATIGGMVACNAAGPRTLRFGATRQWVRGLECVLADGTLARIERGQDQGPGESAALQRWASACQSLRCDAAAVPPRNVRKDSSGYGVRDFAFSGELIDLLVGSEGTLAFFCAAELDLTPLPAATASLLGSWRSIESAVQAAAIARESGAVACELLDASFLRIAARAHALPVDRDTESVLLVELEGDSREAVHADVQALADAWGRTAPANILLGLDPESEESLWALRHAASPILARMDPHVKSMQVVEDGCVPVERLGEYVRGVRAALDACGLDGVLFGHAGDAHVHVNALVDVRRAGWHAAVRDLFSRVAELTHALGGTMAGEHGDGRLRSGELERFWSPAACAIFSRIKATFDPLGILNPGVKVGPISDPLASIKYDPALPHLHVAARTLLDDVERARSYDGLRLEMLEAVG